MAHQTVVRNVCELKFRKARCRVPLFAAFLLASMAPGSQAGTLLFRKAGDIWSMNTDGSGQVQQTFIGNADLGRLSNGVFVYRNGTQLYRQALSPGAPSIPIPQTDGVYDFDLDPTGTKLAIVYTSNFSFDLYTMNIDGSGQRKINSVGMHQIAPAYGRDGYIYLDQSTFGNAFTQMLYRIPDSGVNNAVLLTNYFSQSPAPGGPGNRVAFVYNQPAPMLSVMNSDGSGQVNVPNSPSGIFGRIAFDYESDVVYYQFRDQIWSINTAGSNMTLLASGADTGYGVTYGKSTAPVCIYSISPASQTVAAAGGSVNVAVTTSSACSWTAASDMPWASITAGSAGQGTGNVTIAIGSNPATPRTATLKIAEQIFTISQLGSADPGSQTGTLLFRKAGDIWSMDTDGSGQVQQTFIGSADLGRLANGVFVYKNGTQLYRRRFSPGALAVPIPQTDGVYDFDLDPTGTKLAIAYTANFSFDLYTMHIDGSGQQKINSVGMHQIAPAYGRDGYIYLDQSIFGNAYTQKLYRIQDSGLNNAALLTNYFTQNPAPGGPGNRVAFVYNQPAPMLSVMNSDGSGQTIVPNSPAGVSGRIAFDYQNEVIYYQLLDQIWRINTDGSSLALLASGADIGYGVTYGKTVAPVCTYSISPTSQTVPASGGSVIVAVATSSACTWTAVSDMPWASITSGSAGQGAGNVTVSVGSNSANARTATLNIAGQILTINQAGSSSSFLLNPQALNFTYRYGAPTPAPQSFSVLPDIGKVLAFSVSVAAGSGWLSITPASGLSPVTIQVAVNPTALSPNAYTGSLVVSVPGAQPATRSIPVDLVVEPDIVDPSLAIDTPSLAFTLMQGAATQAMNVAVRNTGTGMLAFQSSVSTSDTGSWLTAVPLTGVTSFDSPATLTVQASAKGLAAGTYTGAVTVNTPDANAIVRSMTIPVTATVQAAQQSLVLSQTGMSFTAVAGGGNGLPQSFGILNIGQGRMSWTLSASTSGGGSWLAVDQPGGITDAGASSTIPAVNVSVNATGLTPGTYYGQIHVAAPAATNPDQYVSVVLNVLPAGSDPGPLVLPTGLIFTGIAGGAAPAPENLTVSTVGPANTFNSGFVSLDGAGWLTTNPSLSTGGTIAAQSPANIAVKADSSKLTSGVYKGTITFVFGAGSSRTVEVLFVLYPVPASSRTPARAQTNCSPASLSIVSTLLGNLFSASVGWPVPLDAQVVDNCGNPMTTGSVTATFSNGDPPLSLVSLHNGHWAATWAPRNSGTASVSLIFHAETPSAIGVPITTTTEPIPGSLQTNVSVPVINSGGIVSAASNAFQRPLAPGSMVSIYGSRLSQSQAAAGSLPLPMNLGGSSVQFGSTVMPLLYTSTGQVNAMIPYGTAVDTTHQVFVSLGSSISVPEPITVAAAAPGVFTVDGKQGIALYGANIADSAHPAKAGDVLVIYCTGLGEVSPSIVAGAPAPMAPLSKTLNTVTATIGGVAASVQFAGLAPGYAGLYQVNAIVPSGITAGGQVPLVLTAAGQNSPPVYVAIR